MSARDADRMQFSRTASIMQNHAIMPDRAAMAAEPNSMVDMTGGAVQPPAVPTAGANFGHETAPGSFRDYRFDNGGIATLRRLIGRPSVVGAELFGAIERLNRRPVSTFANIEHLYAGAGDRQASGPSARAIRILR